MSIDGPGGRLVVDRGVCVGAGQCVLSSPEFFDQDETGQVVVRSAAPLTAEQARIAADLCPSGALTLARPAD